LSNGFATFLWFLYELSNRVCYSFMNFIWITKWFCYIFIIFIWIIQLGFATFLWFLYELPNGFAIILWFLYELSSRVCYIFIDFLWITHDFGIIFNDLYMNYQVAAYSSRLTPQVGSMWTHYPRPLASVRPGVSLDRKPTVLL
jgi:hypothetical protein